MAAYRQGSCSRIDARLIRSAFHDDHDDHDDHVRCRCCGGRLNSINVRNRGIYLWTGPLDAHELVSHHSLYHGTAEIKVRRSQNCDVLLQLTDPLALDSVYYRKRDRFCLPADALMVRWSLVRPRKTATFTQVRLDNVNIMDRGTLFYLPH